MGPIAAYTIATILSLALHGAVIFALLINWQADSQKTIVQPQYIEAQLVQLAAKTKPVPKSTTAMDPAKVKREAERKKAQAKREAEKKKALAKRQAAEREKQRLEAEKQHRIERERQRLALEQAQREAEFAEALAQEQAMLKAQEDEKVANSYMQLIQQRLSENWSRPPSARLGMQVLIELRLVPTGRIVGVTITESSGDLAFDRAAQQAAFKVEQFKELQGMDSAIFEKYFRKVKVFFSPEDLRL
jgi:colicin import membrane protein